MTPPDKITFDQIELGERGRSTYFNIEALAESVLNNGLIQPIVLVPIEHHDADGAWVSFGLDAGGRRYHALKLLLERGDWDGTLHHGATCKLDPFSPGYILKDEVYGSPLQRVMTEIAENLGREDPDWRDQVKLIMKAANLLRTEAHKNGKNIVMLDLGMMLGVQYMELQAAQAIHDDLIANPQRYKDCVSIRGAASKLMKLNEVAITKELAAKSLQSAPKLSTAPTESSSPSVSIQSEPALEGETPPILIELTKSFINGDSLEFMQSITSPCFDHIVTDPDYGVSVERLNANMVDAGAGVAQTSIYESVNQTCAFIDLAWNCIKDQGFLIMFYDLDHHEKLQKYATSVGFRVQRWPLVWHKSDYFSNADPAHNFPKNIEYAMVCRKPNAVLSQAQRTSIFNCPSGNTTREFNHPFAKPVDLWKWIYSAIAIKGQVVFDPFAGSGTSCVAAQQWGLKPVGCELNPDHYSNLILNMQKVIKQQLAGTKVLFQ